MLAPGACITSNAVTQSFCCFLIPWIRLHVCWRVGSFFSHSLDSRICGTAESPKRLKPGSHLRHNDIYPIAETLSQKKAKSKMTKTNRN